MVQIIRRTPPDPRTLPRTKQEKAQQLQAGIQQGLNTWAQYSQQKEAQEQEKSQYEQNNALYQSLEGEGQVLSKDPKIAAAQFSETLKTKGKKELLEEKSNKLSGILGKSQTSNKEGKIDATDIQEEFDPTSVTPEQLAEIATFDPQTANLLQKEKDVALREGSKKTKETTRKNEREQDIAMEHHKEHKDYDQKIRDNYERAVKQRMVVKDVMKAVESGNVKPASLANIFKGHGYWGDKMSEALINEDQAAIQANMPNLIEGWKDVFGIRLSDADLRVVLDKLPSIGKNPEANKAILKIIDKYAGLSEMKYNIAQEIKQTNKGMRPIDYDTQIESKLQNEIKQNETVNVRSPDGKVKAIPRKFLEQALQSGGQLL